MHTHTAVTGKDIRSDNYLRLNAAKLSERQQQVMKAVRLAHARGQRDITNSEICLVMEEQLGRRVTPNQISGRIGDLVTSGLLAENCAPGRACSVTGSTKCKTFRAVAQQAGLGV